MASHAHRIHPSSQRVEALLNHLKPSLERSISIQDDLVVPQTRRSLLHYQNGQLVEEALWGSVTLLDACGAARDLLIILREHVQTLQSALRRRRGDSSIANEISAYVSFRKKAKKEIAKQLVELKRMESQVRSLSTLGLDHNLAFFARVLRDASTISISIFRSLLLFLSMKTKGSSCLISKLKPMGLFSSEKEQISNSEIGDLNLALCSVLERVRNGDAKVEVEVTQRTLGTLNVSIGGIEGGLDCIFRCSVQNSVIS